ncbi:MAG: hypothetical protein RLZZ450_5149, partial [Pseudomonadota bacterium]
KTESPATANPKDAGKPDSAASAKPDSGKAPTKPVLDAGAALPVSLDAATTPVDVDPSGDAASPAGDGGALPPWTIRADLGKGDGSDVITIGDSWMTTQSGGIEGGLDRAGTKYRHYSVGGTTLLSGQIPGQYDRAKSANPKISTAIMTGGGNDIMFNSGSCSTPEKCTEFSGKLTAALNVLWTKMAADGVQDVIYVQYSDNAGATPPENRSGSREPAAICSSGKINCHFVATTDIVAKADLPDSIHPNKAAHDRIAKRLLELMEARKILR